jgi:hypothetical protein
LRRHRLIPCRAQQEKEAEPFLGATARERG